MTESTWYLQRSRMHIVIKVGWVTPLLIAAGHLSKKRLRFNLYSSCMKSMNSTIAYNRRVIVSQFYNLCCRSWFRFVIYGSTNLQSRCFPLCCGSRFFFFNQFDLLQRLQKDRLPKKRARTGVSGRKCTPFNNVSAAERDVDMISGLKKVVGPYCTGGCLGPDDELCWCHYIVSSEALWLSIQYNYGIICMYVCMYWICIWQDTFDYLHVLIYVMIFIIIFKSLLKYYKNKYQFIEIYT